MSNVVQEASTDNSARAAATWAPLQDAGTKNQLPGDVTRMPDRMLASLLDKLSSVYTKYLSLGPGAADTLALWTVFSHTFHLHEHSPRLLAWSPLPGSGKTVVLSLLSHVCANADAASNVSDAYIYALLNQRKTLILDELDTYMGGAKDAVTGILNSGHSRDGAYVGRMTKEGEQWLPTKFSTFCPIAFASKEKTLPDALASRSIMIRMEKLPADKAAALAKYRSLTKGPELKELGAKVANWARGVGSEPLWHDMGVMDARRADTWRPLFALAALAGPNWLERARKAQAAEPAQEQDMKVRLLRDIKEVFDGSKQDALATEVILGKLHEGEWEEMPSSGKPLTSAGLARMLRPHRIKPGPIELGPTRGGKRRQGRGYRRAQFEPVWAVTAPVTAS